MGLLGGGSLNPRGPCTGRAHILVLPGMQIPSVVQGFVPLVPCWRGKARIRTLQLASGPFPGATFSPRKVAPCEFLSPVSGGLSIVQRLPNLLIGGSLALVDHWHVIGLQSHPLRRAGVFPQELHSSQLGTAALERIAVATALWRLLGAEPELSASRAAFLSWLCCPETSRKQLHPLSSPWPCSSSDPPSLERLGGASSCTRNRRQRHVSLGQACGRWGQLGGDCWRGSEFRWLGVCISWPATPPEAW